MVLFARAVCRTWQHIAVCTGQKRKYKLIGCNSVVKLRHDTLECTLLTPCYSLQATHYTLQLTQSHDPHHEPRTINYTISHHATPRHAMPYRYAHYKTPNLNSMRNNTVVANKADS